MTAFRTPIWLESPAGEDWHVKVMQVVDILRLAEVELGLSVRGYILSLSQMVIENTLSEHIVNDVIDFLSQEKDILPFKQAKRLLAGIIA